MFEMSASRGGLQSRSAFEDIASLSQKANEIAVLMWKWRKCECGIISCQIQFDTDMLLQLSSMLCRRI